MYGWINVMEYSYEAYIDHIVGELSPDGVHRAARGVRPLGKFICEEGIVPRPVPYYGYTLISPPSGNDGVNGELYKLLETVSRQFDHFIGSFGLIEANPRYRHMTLARLVSGSTFVAQFPDASCEAQFRSDIQTVLAGLLTDHPVRCQICGISLLAGGVIAAAVDFVTRTDFEVLHRFRDAVYGDQRLVRHGVDRARPFRGHISLFYIEKPPASDCKAALAEAIISVNRTYFSTPLPFTIHRAELCRFADFTAFTRKPDWPAFEFTPPRTRAEPFDFPLRAPGPVSEAFHSRAIETFSAACSHVAGCAYRRVSQPDNPLAVLEESCGTCSSKHVILKQLADEQGQGASVRLMLGIFFWGVSFSPKLESVLADSGFTELPEVHCYLRIDGAIVDLTSATWGRPRFVDTLAHEMELFSTDSATARKRETHREWMAAWLEQEHPDADFEDTWALREACIHSLSHPE